MEGAVETRCWRRGAIQMRKRSLKALEYVPWKYNGHDPLFPKKPEGGSLRQILKRVGRPDAGSLTPFFPHMDMFTRRVVAL